MVDIIKTKKVDITTNMDTIKWNTKEKKLNKIKIKM